MVERSATETQESPQLDLPHRSLPEVAVAASQESDPEHEFLCRLWRSVRYHRAREAFFQGWSSTFQFVSLIAGSSVVVTILSDAPAMWSLAAGAAVAVMQGAELVFRLADKARMHNALAAEFHAIERVAVMTGDLSDAKLRELRGEMLAVESREPPIKRYLDLICHNQVARSIGSDDTAPLAWWQIRFSQYLAGPAAG